MHRLISTAAHLGPRTRKQRGKVAVPSLWLMTDAVRGTNPITAIRRMPRGSGVILRHTDRAQLRALAEATVPLCRRRGIVCLIAGDWRLAARLHAHGIHLSERATRVGVMAAALGWRRHSGHMMTTSAHGLTAMLRGARLKADAIVLAPVFTTASHPAARVLGAVRFASLVRKVLRPVIALGGISAKTVKRLRASGACGIAGIGWAEA